MEVISEMAVKKMDKEYSGKAGVDGCKVDGLVEQIRTHWLHRKADFTVVENLIPNLTGEGLEYSDSKDGENVLWQFKPVHEAWQKHLEVRCFFPDPCFLFHLGGRKLTPQTPNHDPPSGRANSEHGHIRYGLLSS